mmetsp:Transcript_45972/g.121577  ORF Transcript_45972/g.121577 Transcript_45972/m.121577 type:complete len:426 (+) Transcript_45972:41-1318(+)
MGQSESTAQAGAAFCSPACVEVAQSSTPSCLPCHAALADIDEQIKKQKTKELRKKRKRGTGLGDSQIITADDSVGLDDSFLSRSLTSMLGGASEEPKTPSSPTPSGRKGWNALLKTTPFAKNLKAAKAAGEGGDAAAEAKPASRMQGLVQKAKKAQEELATAAMRGDIRRLQKAAEGGANIQASNVRGVVPLMLAACANGPTALACVKWLLDQGAEVIAKDKNGWTALHHAARSGKLESAQVLIENGADVLAKTGDSQNTVMLACMEAHKELVDLLLQQVRDPKTLVSERDSLGWTAIHHAAKVGKSDIIRTLLDAQASPGDKDNDGKRPLMVAAENGRLKAVKLLIGTGKAGMDSKDKNGFTAMMHAIASKQEEVAIWLVSEKRADTGPVGSTGQNVIQMAEELSLTGFIQAAKRTAALVEKGK